MIKQITRLFHNLIEKGMLPGGGAQKGKADTEISSEADLSRPGPAQQDKSATQTLDRKAFERSVNESLNRGRETGCLLVCDVDRCKEINDTYGHDTGSAVLVCVGDVLRSIFEDYICFGSFDGDVFALWLSEASGDSAGDIRRRVGIVNDRLLHPAGELPPVSVSAGAVFYKADDDCKALVQRAYKALYLVKGSGGCGCEV